MGHYIRLLSPSDLVPDLDHVQEIVGPKATLTLEDGEPDDWIQATVAHPDGPQISLIERHLVRPGELGAAEIDEFMSEAEDCRPTSARHWLREYLPTVQCIYAFQCLPGAREGDGWWILNYVRFALHKIVGGIMQADWEGFSNEEGYHILWQFSDRATGQWWMAVMIDGEWVTFRMELDNKGHREAFLRGELPAGITASRPEE